MTPPALLDPAVWAEVERALHTRRPLTFAIGAAEARLHFVATAHNEGLIFGTEVFVDVASTPLCLEVGPRWVTDALAARLGLAIDLRTGDADFDARYAVEAAPAELARAALDDTVRAGLRAIHPTTVTLEADRLMVRCGEPTGVEAERTTVRVAAALTARLAEEAAPGADRVDPAGHYRGGAEGWRAREATWRAELARLRAVRLRRGVVGAAGAVAAAAAALRIWG